MISSTSAMEDTFEIHQLRYTLPWYLGRFRIKFWGGICCSMTSGRGQSHRQYRLWKKHLEVGVVSPPSPGAGVWTQFPGIPDRLALGACSDGGDGRWGSYLWWLEGSPQCIRRCWHREPGDAAEWSRAEQHRCRGILMTQNARPWHLRLCLVRSSWRRTGTSY